MFCPKCGNTNVVKQNQHPNGGDLFVAEECGSSTEFFDDAIHYECNDCDTTFYVNNTFFDN